MHPIWFYLEWVQTDDSHARLINVLRRDRFYGPRVESHEQLWAVGQRVWILSPVINMHNLVSNRIPTGHSWFHSGKVHQIIYHAIIGKWKDPCKQLDQFAIINYVELSDLHKEKHRGVYVCLSTSHQPASIAGCVCSCILTGQIKRLSFIFLWFTSICVVSEVRTKACNYAWAAEWSSSFAWNGTSAAAAAVVTDGWRW